jgi:hypothetical protein
MQNASPFVYVYTQASLSDPAVKPDLSVERLLQPGAIEKTVDRVELICWRLAGDT